jgi:hypothetical protein
LRFCTKQPGGPATQAVAAGYSSGCFSNEAIAGRLSAFTDEELAEMGLARKKAKK